MNPEEAMRKMEEFVGFSTELNVPEGGRLIQGRAELKEFAKTLFSLEPKNLGLEIGLAHGGTHFFWRLFFEKVISIDNGQVHHNVAIKRLTDFGCDMSKSTFIFGDSTQQATIDEAKRHLGDQKLDFLFIDGGHAYKVVKSDFKNYMPLVRKGGIVAMHDAGNGTPPPVSDTQSAAIRFNKEARQYGVSGFTFIKLDHQGIAWSVKR